MSPCPHALLVHPDLGVRPPGVPVPPALAAWPGPLTEVFNRWLRQRDDATHAAEKSLVLQVMRAVSDAAVREEAARQAALAVQCHGWDHWVWAVPAGTVAGLLGMRVMTVPQQHLLVRQLRAIAAALAPEATRASVMGGHAAVAALLQALRQAEADAPDAPLQAAWLHHRSCGDRKPWADAMTREAHRLAWLWQSHEAGSALLGHGLWQLAVSGEAPDRDGLRAIARDGGAVRLTRRFAQRDLAVGGVAVAAGAPVTVLLAGSEWIFGAGAHACPGESMALTTAASALRWVQASAYKPLPTRHRAMTLANMTVLLFDDEPAGAEGDVTAAVTVEAGTEADVKRRSWNESPPSSGVLA
ncbi:hypothetical protein [Roseateles terrae]|uniref:Cytochrome P450 n=1 Tax=Roseateles terrae TaxID=431060 RepID=A0ABR6GYM2_9BURK|nr:hypothetical protein [Roseateles terrae]MBB3197209.1 cytochrome P450 [Roseateles terrae]OWQ83722.1 hypothetical protein CDN98_22040 [Roseateles terrae]